MKVFFSNINFNDDIESFIIAKGKLEKELIEEGKIEKKLSISEFLEQIGFEKTIAYFDRTDPKKMKTISLIIHKLKNDELIIFYISDFSQEYNEQLFEKLKKIDYDFSKLKKLNQINFLNTSIKQYFVVNGDFCIFDK